MRFCEEAVSQPLLVVRRGNKDSCLHAELVMGHKNIFYSCACEIQGCLSCGESLISGWLSSGFHFMNGN